MKVKLKEIADVIAGQSPASKYYSDCDGFPFLQGNRTFGDRYPLIDSFTSKITKAADAGDVLISVRAPVGDINIAPCDLCIGRGLAAIKAKDGDNAFLYYALKQNVRTLTKRGNGTTYDSVDADTLQNLDLLIPEKEDLRAYIARLLNTLDDSIENNSSICSDLEATAKLLYDYWFVQFDFPDENGKPYKSSGGKMVWNDELKREIPEGWNVRQISDLVKIKKGISYKSSEITGGGTPMINLASFNLDGTYKPSGIKFFSGTVDVNRTVNACDLIMCVTQQTDIDLTGRTNVIGKAILTPDLFDGQVVISTDVVKLETETADIRFWLEGLFKQAYIHKYIVGYANGTKIKHLDVYEALNFFVACPPDDSRVLQRYSSIRATQMELYSNLQGEIEFLTKTRDFLLPLLMNGQVTIGDDDK